MEKERKKPAVQFEEQEEDVKPEEDGKETDSRETLEMRKRSAIKDMRANWKVSSAWMKQARTRSKKMGRSTRQSSIWRSVNCEQEELAEAATHRGPVGAALIQPSWSNLQKLLFV